MTRLDASTWTEVERVSSSGGLLLLPVGSTEQHGPHLPLSTDTDIARAVALGAARRTGGLAVAPALAYGSSGEHRDFCGTLSIGQHATELVVLELGRSAGDHFGGVVVVSTHGGNERPVSRAVAQLEAEGLAIAAWSPSWGGDLHAGRTETSLMLAIAPDRVRLDSAEAGDLRPMATLAPLLFDGGVRSVSPNGVLGDPAGASAEEGHRLLEGGVEQLVRTIGGLRGEPAAEVSR